MEKWENSEPNDSFVSPTRRLFLTAAGTSLIGLQAGLASATHEEDEEWDYPEGSPLETSVETEPLIINMDGPWDFAFTPTDDLFVTERGGELLRFDAEEVLNVEDDPVDAGDVGDSDRIQLGSYAQGVTVHPEYPDAPWVYVYYNDGTEDQVGRLDPTADDPERTLEQVTDGWEGDQWSGGRIRFGPEGDLWITVGTFAEEDPISQDPSALPGSILRVTPEGEPSDANPEIEGGDPRVFTYGFRNPQGLSWLPNGRTISTDHGPEGRDEMQRLIAGENHGWPEARGGPDDPDYDSYDEHDEYVPPLVNTGPDLTWAPSGCVFYEGDDIPEWQNRILVASLRGMSIEIVSLVPPDEDQPPLDGESTRYDEDWLDDEYTATTHRVLHEEDGRLRTIEEAPTGDLLLMNSNNDHGAGIDDDDPFPRKNDDMLLRIVPVDDEEDEEEVLHENFDDGVDHFEGDEDYFVATENQAEDGQYTASDNPDIDDNHDAIIYDPNETTEAGRIYVSEFHVDDSGSIFGWLFGTQGEPGGFLGDYTGYLALVNEDEIRVDHWDNDGSYNQVASASTSHVLDEGRYTAEIDYRDTDDSELTLTIYDDEGAEEASVTLADTTYDSGSYGLYYWAEASPFYVDFVQDEDWDDSDEGDQEEDEEEAVSVVTRGASDVGKTTAKLHGELSELEGFDQATVHFEWGEVDQGLPNTTDGQTLESPGDFDEQLEGLEEGTEYEFRAVAKADDERDEGSSESFTTHSDTAPDIDDFEVRDVSNPTWTRAEVDWAVSDETGDLDEVTTRLVHADTGYLADSETTSVSGTSASGTDELRERNGGGEYEVELIVKNSQETTTETKEVVLGDDDGDDDDGDDDDDDDNGDGDADPPEIDRFDLTDTSNPRWARVEVDWAVSGDAELEEVTTTLNGGVDSESSSVDGTTASGTHELRERGGHGEVVVTLTVTDTAGNETSEEDTIVLS